MLACLVCTRTVDDVGEDGQHGNETKSISTKHGSIRLFTFQLKQMAARITAGALYRTCRPGCIPVNKHDMHNGNPVVHPSSDEMHDAPETLETPETQPFETQSPDFSLKSYKMDTPVGHHPSSAPNDNMENGDLKGVAVKTTRAIQRVQSQQSFNEVGSPYATASPVVVKGVDSEWVAQVQDGVYITFHLCPDGFNDLKRIKFRRSMYSKEEAEIWWTQNCAMVRELYNVRPPNMTPVDDDRLSSGYATPEPYSNSHNNKSPCHV